MSLEHQRSTRSAAAGRQLLFIELNEVNFDFVRHYAERGLLPHLQRIIQQHGVRETTSEERYEHLEPWIQWVTAHTGRSFAEHGVFRLGDIVHHDIPQIWEELEAAGLRVGAISPMNARHRLRDPAFFVPDPWTSTKITAPPLLTRLHGAIGQTVNDNASSRVTLRSLVSLLAGACAYARVPNYGTYAGLAASGRGHPWRRAMFLDLLLGDVFLKEVRRTRPHFATLFLNAAAHIQHHYMFCSSAYAGEHRNPPWYVDNADDPVLEVLSLYDRMLGNLRAAFPASRIMVATGLHQKAHEHLTFYWRLRNHASFLERIGVPFRRVEPRMSRDFLVVCASEADALSAAQRMAKAVTADGTRLFEVDNRGRDLFVTLTYPHDIRAGFEFSIDSEKIRGFEDDIAFVAVKNGEHNGVGYFIDTGENPGAQPRQFPLAQIPELIAAALGVSLRLHESAV